MYTSLKNQVRKLTPTKKISVYVNCGIRGKAASEPPKDCDVCITCSILPDNYDGGKI